MITSWDIYWITRLDVIGVFFAVLLICYIAALIVGFIATCAGELWNDDCWPVVKKSWKWGIISFIIFMFVSFFVPSTKQAAAIYLIPKIANNEHVQKLPDNAMRFLNGKFEEWIEDMTKQKKK